MHVRARTHMQAQTTVVVEVFQIFELAPRFKENLSRHTVFEVIKLKRADAMIILAVGFHAGLGVSCQVGILQTVAY